jgi:hypothetical protein
MFKSGRHDCPKHHLIEPSILIVLALRIPFWVGDFHINPFPLVMKDPLQGALKEDRSNPNRGFLVGRFI